MKQLNEVPKFVIDTEEKASTQVSEPFQTAIIAALLRGVDPNDIAARFETMRGTVDRWAQGTARPTPRVSEMVVEWLSTAPVRRFATVSPPNITVASGCKGDPDELCFEWWSGSGGITVYAKPTVALRKDGSEFVENPPPYLVKNWLEEISSSNPREQNTTQPLFPPFWNEAQSWVNARPEFTYSTPKIIDEAITSLSALFEESLTAHSADISTIKQELADLRGEFIRALSRAPCQFASKALANNGCSDDNLCETHRSIGRPKCQQCGGRERILASSDPDENQTIPCNLCIILPKDEI